MDKEPPRITAFIGVVGSGKDYRANQLSEKGHVRIDFKDELIAMCSDIAGYDVSKDYDWFKNHIVGVHRSSNPLSDAFIASEQKELLTKYPDLITGRKLLQRVGTEVMRKRDRNYWVNQFCKKAAVQLKSNKSVVNADCRFFNEVEILSRMDAATSVSFIFCNYKSNRYDTSFDHPSEKLAQTFLGMDIKDGQELFHSDFVEAAKRMNEQYE